MNLGSGLASRAMVKVGTLCGPGEISLGHYLLFAFLVRLPAVFLARGFEFPDHQFQYVDPAYRFGLGGSWWEPEDYVTGARSRVYPYLLAGLFWLIDRVGITEAGAMMVATRLVHALISLLPVAALWMLVVRWKNLPGRRPLLLLAACNPLLVYAGVQPTGPTVATGLSLAAVFLFHGARPAWPLLSGLLLGAAFACRPQDALFGPVLFTAGLLQRRWRACLFLSLGCTVMLAVQGVVDLYDYGVFFGSPVAYFNVNVFGGWIHMFTQPWWYYWAIVVGLCWWVPPFLSSGYRALRHGARQFPILLFGTVFYVFVHSLIERKAFRFVLPALVLTGIVFAEGLLHREEFRSKTQTILRKIHLRLWVATSVTLWVVASVYYCSRGPVEAARALSRRPDFQDQLLVVDGGVIAVGGHYYLRRQELEVTTLRHPELQDWLDTHRPIPPLYLMVCRKALPENAISSPWIPELVGEFGDWPVTKNRHRRFLYRVDREPER